MVASGTSTLIIDCMANLIGVPLPGLANLNTPLSGTSSDNSNGFVKINKMSAVPKGKNPFERIGRWNTKELLDSLEVVTSPIQDTTEATRRSQSNNSGGNINRKPTNTRHYRSNVTFKCNGYESKVIKNFSAGIPRVKTRDYGDNYCYASLQKAIADKVIKAYADQNIRVTCVENNVNGADDEWWATISNMAGRTGFIKQKQFVEKPLSAVFNNPNNTGGVVANIDMVLSVKLKKEDNMERDANDVFTIAVECSRCVIAGINEDIPPPNIKSQVPTISLAKDDIIDDELANALDAM